MIERGQITGNQDLLKVVENLVTNGHFPHASMFMGPEGNEKLRIAYYTARMLLCHQPGLEGPCGQCEACLKTQILAHSDIQFSFPFVKPAGAKNEFGADEYILEFKEAIKSNPFLNVYEWVRHHATDKKEPNITAYECQQIIRKLQMKPYEGEKKVMIIWMPEFLEKEGNKLLKIIEEPPQGTYLIFVCENRDKVLTTILSRCQIFAVSMMDRLDVQNLLVYDFKKDLRRAELASYLAEGNMMEALSLFSDEKIEKNNLFIDWLRLCYRYNFEGLVQWVDQFSNLNKEEQKYILNFGIHFLKEMIKIKWQLTNLQVSLPQSLIEIATNMSKQVGIESLSKMVEILDQEIYYIERNCNTRIQLMATSGTFYKLFSKAGSR